MLSQRQIIKAISGLQEIFSPSLLFIIISVIIVCIVMKISVPVFWHKYRRYFWLVVYILFLLEIMWLGRTPSEVSSGIEWMPFIRIYENQVLHETRLIGAVLNILIYIPYGYLLESAKKCRWISIGMVLCTTLIIEYGQYVYAVGTFKTENLITNTLGGVLGMVLYNQIDKRKNND